MLDYSEDRDAIEAIKANSARIVNPGSIETLFSPDFMQARTNFGHFDGFLAGAPSPMEFPEGDLLRAPEGWDTYVAEHSSFKTWKEMATAAELFMIDKRKRGEIPLGDLTVPDDMDAL